MLHFLNYDTVQKNFEPIIYSTDFIHFINLVIFVCVLVPFYFLSHYHAAISALWQGTEQVDSFDVWLFYVYKHEGCWFTASLLISISFIAWHLFFSRVFHSPVGSSHQINFTHKITTFSVTTTNSLNRVHHSSPVSYWHSWL